MIDQQLEYAARNVDFSKRGLARKNQWKAVHGSGIDPEKQYGAEMMQVLDWLKEIKRFDIEYFNQMMKQEKYKSIIDGYANTLVENRWRPFM